MNLTLEWDGKRRIRKRTHPPSLPPSFPPSLPHLSQGLCQRFFRRSCFSLLYVQLAKVKEGGATGRVGSKGVL